MMNYNQVSPNWAGFKRLWWIVAIALFILTLLLWLLGFGRLGLGDRHCASPTTTVEKLVDNPDHLARITLLEQENGVIAGLQSRITELQGMPAVVLDTSKLELKIKNLETENATISGLQSRISELEGMPATLADSSELQSRIKNLKALNATIPGLHAKITELERMLNTRGNQNTSGLAEARVFFDVNSSIIPPAGRLYLSPVINYMKINPGSLVALSGFHDPSGNSATNNLLAYDRATAVKTMLTQSGIDIRRISLAPPTITTGTGIPAEARRVEIKLYN
ncbi:MAG: OmpA family protein [Gammaproteobacteria bacterium]